MKKELKRFNILCQNIITEKRSNLYTKVLSDRRYLEEDFDQLWEGSGFKKLLIYLKGAFSSASDPDNLLSNKDIEQMFDKSSKTYEDLPVGSVNPNSIGIKLTYDIFNEYKYSLLKMLLLRDDENSEANSKFGMYITYINEIINKAEETKRKIQNIKTPIKLEIIAAPTSKNNTDSFDKNKHYSHFTEKGFDCTIFLWFDASEFLKETQELLNSNNTANPDADTSTDEKKEDLKNSLLNINPNKSKIKLGTLNMEILGNEEGTIANLAKGFVNVDLAGALLKPIGKKIYNNILGFGNKTAEQPDKIKVNKSTLYSIFNIADISKPYINVVSKVILEPWLFKNNYLKSADSEKNNTNMALQKRKPFNEALLKVDATAPGKLTNNLGNGKVWSIGNKSAGAGWDSKNEDNSAMMKNYLKNLNSNKAVTCRWQYYLDKSRTYFAEYRIAISLKDLYNILIDLDTKIKLIDNKFSNLDMTEMSQVYNMIKSDPSKNLADQMVNNFIQEKYVPIVHFLNTDMDASAGYTAAGNSKNNWEYFKYLLAKNNIIVKQVQTRKIDYDLLNIKNIFNDWWINRYMAQNDIAGTQPNDDFALQSQKRIKNNKINQINSNPDVVSKNGLAALNDSDSMAAAYFNDNVCKNPNTININGISLNELFVNITDSILQQIDIVNLKNIFSNINNFNNLLEHLKISNIQLSNTDKMLIKNSIIKTTF